MQEQEIFDFEAIAEAITYFRSSQFDLFSTGFVSAHQEKEQLLTLWAQGCPPAKLVRYLEPVRIKPHIGKTILAMKQNRTSPVFIHTMTAEEYSGGTAIEINYGFYSSRFGEVLIASTTKGVCFIGFTDNVQESALNDLRRRFPFAVLIALKDGYQQKALSALENPEETNQAVTLHLRGTPFQLNIWNQLLHIPFGGLVSYASLTNDKKNARAVGSAVGDNPVAYLVPCHRVVRISGDFGPYYWGAERKAALISWEAARAGQAGNANG